MDLDMADIKPTLYNTLYIGITAVVFIVFMKYITARYKLPMGMTEVFQAA